MQTRTAALLVSLALALTACASAGQDGYNRIQRPLVPSAVGAASVADDPAEVIGGKGKGLDMASKPVVASLVSRGPEVHVGMPRPHPHPH